MTHAKMSWALRFAGFGAATVAAAAMVTAGATPAAAEGTILGAGQSNAIKDSYLVELAAGSLDVQSVAGALAGDYGARIEHVYRHALRGFAATMSEANARKLAADPAVKSVQQNVTASLSAVQFNPPSWGLDRIDHHNPLHPGSYTYPNEGAGVTAYVIDSGIRITHQEFGVRARWGANTVDFNNFDCNGHGTHVAGTIGGTNYGVAKQVDLVAVKAFNCQGQGSAATVTAAVDWVTGDHIAGPAVANMSLGFAPPVPMIDMAVRNSIFDGVVYAVASMNSAVDACWYSPARLPEAITVNATAQNDSRAVFSDYGMCTDIFAPGVDIPSAWWNGDAAINTISGTSMATPHVAGAAALVLAANPFLNPQQVAATLYADATPNLVTNPGPGSPNRLLFVSHPVPPQPPAGPARLVRGQLLTANQMLVSPAGLYRLLMQADGNLVLYNQFNQAVWQLGTAGYPGAFLTFQPDGNLVLRRADGFPLTYTGTNGTASDRFVVEDDSDVMIYGTNDEIYWRRL